MKWINLKSNKCPDCGKAFGPISWGNRPGYIVCSNCNFTISESKYSKIVNSQINEKIERELNQEYDKR